VRPIAQLNQENDNLYIQKAGCKIHIGLICTLGSDIKLCLSSL